MIETGSLLITVNGIAVCTDYPAAELMVKADEKLLKTIEEYANQ
jgi:hypothetical protein